MTGDEPVPLGQHYTSPYECPFLHVCWPTQGRDGIDYPVTRANYYHPDMLGSWSIKAVLPTIAPDMDYAALEGIHEGTEASAAYLEAVHPETAPERREELRRHLLHYCRHDTAAMVRLVHFFGEA